MMYLKNYRYQEVSSTILVHLSFSNIENSPNRNLEYNDFYEGTVFQHFVLNIKHLTTKIKTLRRTTYLLIIKSFQNWKLDTSVYDVCIKKKKLYRYYIL